jgi:hypothetical protein
MTEAIINRQALLVKSYLLNALLINPNSEPWVRVKFAPIDNRARLHILRFRAFPPSRTKLLLPGKCKQSVRHLS